MKTLPIEYFFITGIMIAGGYWMCLSNFEGAVCVLLGAILGNLQYMNMKRKP